MITTEDLLITKHAQNKMNVEGIGINQIIEALERGSKFSQTDGLLVVYNYFSVAYKQIGQKYIIKTVFLNR